jgi:hydrogenase maturation protease
VESSLERSGKTWKCSLLLEIIMMPEIIKTLVIGIGSPVLSDGRAPLTVIDALRENQKTGKNTHFVTIPAGGIDLLSEIEGYARAIIVTAFPGGGDQSVSVGETVIETSLTGSDSTTALPGDHGVEITDVLALGKQCGYTIPETVVLIGIYGANVHSLGEQISDKVAHVVKKITQRVEELIDQWDT